MNATARRWPAIVVVVATPLTAAPAATAADAPAPGGDLEEIIVTGSRIPRADFESASPVVTIPQDRFEQTPAPTLEATLYYLPQFAGGTNGSSNNDPDNPQGQAQVALRGLGSKATLVLVDSRRLIPANGNGVPDVNVIPPSLVERVEILTGGASAVYGSDALAGVMNVRLRHNYEGLEFAGDWGQTGRGDGQTYAATLTAGTNFADGRGALMGAIGYSERKLVTQAERKYSRVPLRWIGPGTGGQGPGGQFVPTGSGNILEGRYSFGNNQPSHDAFAELFGSYGYAACTAAQEQLPPSEQNCLPYQTDMGFNSDGTLFTQGNGDPGTVANFRGVKDPLTYNDRAYQFNYAPYQALMMPLDRTSVFLNGSFEFSDAAELYAQGIYAGYTVTEQLAPTPIPRVFMPPTNPYIPADLKFLLDSRPNPAGRIALSKRTLETGVRDTDHDYSFFQLALGLRGTVFTDWQYNGYVQYGQSDQTMTVYGNVSVSKLEELFYAPDGGQSICGGADPFGLNSISPECSSYISVTTRDRSNTSQTTAEFSLSGSPFELPAGALNAVFGLFYRKDTYEQNPDPQEQNILPDGRPDVAGFSSGWLPMSASDHNVDAYTEMLAPLLADVPGVKSLTTVLGYRWSDYASAGTTSTYKAELLYEPVDALLVRGSFQHAVRAPSVFERYEPQVPEIAGYDAPDPCSAGSAQRSGPNGAAVDALCVAQGIPADQLATFYDDSGEALGYFGGNPQLKPEKGRTWTAGVVFNSPFDMPALRHLQLSLDWWDIQLRDAIEYYVAADFIPHCYDPAYNPGFSADNKYCRWFARDAEAGGYIVDAYEIERNIAVVETSGIDLQLDWRMGAGPGEIGATWLLSWLESYDFQSDPEVKQESWRGTGCCPTLPEWKWNLDTHYQVGGFTANVIWSYLGHIDGRAMDGQDHPSFQVPVRNYVDLTATYAFEAGSLDGLTLRIGVTNVFDEQPPIFPAHGNANSDLAAYDALGRSVWLGVNYAVRPGRN